MTNHNGNNNAPKIKSGSYSHGLALLYLVGLSVMILGPLIAIIVGSIKGRKQPQYRTLIYFAIAFIIIHGFLFEMWFKPNYDKQIYTGKIGQLKLNTQIIDVALSRYYWDNCHYPDNAEFLFSQGYYNPDSLINPFTNRPMELIPYDPDDYFYSIGYIPSYYDQNPIAYYIVGFGDDKTPGIDIDGDGEGNNVIIVLSSGWDCVKINCFDDTEPSSIPGPLLPIEEEIKNLKWVWR